MYLTTILQLRTDSFRTEDALDNQNTQEKGNTEWEGGVFQGIDEDEDFAHEMSCPHFRMADTKVVVKDFQFQCQKEMAVNQEKGHQQNNQHLEQNKKCAYRSCEL